MTVLMMAMDDDIRRLGVMLVMIIMSRILVMVMMICSSHLLGEGSHPHSRLGRAGCECLLAAAGRRPEIAGI